MKPEIQKIMMDDELLSKTIKESYLTGCRATVAQIRRNLLEGLKIEDILKIADDSFDAVEKASPEELEKRFNDAKTDK